METVIWGKKYKTTIREAISDVLRKNPNKWFNKKEIAIMVTKEHPKIAKNDESIFRELRRMVQEGLVYREGKQYRWIE